MKSFGYEKKCILSSTKNRGVKNPLFMVHGIDGGIIGYKSIARYLEKERPLYDFRSYLNRNSESILTSILLMAERYISELVQVQPKGPYLIGGHSIGAFIAYEMAALLQKKGKQVELLFLLDMIPNIYFRNQLGDQLILKVIGKYFNINIFQIYAQLRDVCMKDVSKDFNRLSDNQRIQMLQKCIAKAGAEEIAQNILLDKKSNYLAHCYNILKANLMATINYHKVSQYSGRAVIIYTKQYRQMRGKHHDLGWGSYIKDDIIMEEVPGDHFSMLREPHVKVLVEKLNMHLIGKK